MDNTTTIKHLEGKVALCVNGTDARQVTAEMLRRMRLEPSRYAEFVPMLEARLERWESLERLNTSHTAC